MIIKGPAINNMEPKNQNSEPLIKNKEKDKKKEAVLIIKGPARKVNKSPERKKVCKRLMLFVAIYIPIVMIAASVAFSPDFLDLLGNKIHNESVLQKHESEEGEAPVLFMKMICRIPNGEGEVCLDALKIIKTETYDNKLAFMISRLIAEDSWFKKATKLHGFTILEGCVTWQKVGDKKAGVHVNFKRKVESEVSAVHNKTIGRSSHSKKFRPQHIVELVWGKEGDEINMLVSLPKNEELPKEYKMRGFNLVKVEPRNSINHHDTGALHSAFNLKARFRRDLKESYHRSIQIRSTNETDLNGSYHRSIQVESRNETGINNGSGLQKKVQSRSGMFGGPGMISGIGASSGIGMISSNFPFNQSVEIQSGTSGSNDTYNHSELQSGVTTHPVKLYSNGTVSPLPWVYHNIHHRGSGINTNISSLDMNPVNQSDVNDNSSLPEMNPEPQYGVNSGRPNYRIPEPQNVTNIHEITGRDPEPEIGKHNSSNQMNPQPENGTNFSVPNYRKPEPQNGTNSSVPNYRKPEPQNGTNIHSEFTDKNPEPQIGANSSAPAYRITEPQIGANSSAPAYRIPEPQVANGNGSDHYPAQVQSQEGFANESYHYPAQVQPQNATGNGTYHYRANLQSQEASGNESYLYPTQVQPQNATGNGTYHYRANLQPQEASGNESYHYPAQVQPQNATANGSYHYPAILQPQAIENGSYPYPAILQPQEAIANATDQFPKMMRLRRDINKREPKENVDDYWSRYTGDPSTSCIVPKKGLQTAEILCKVWPHSITCNAFCVYGHTYQEGIVRTLNCSFEKNRWSNYFEECQPFVNCNLHLASPGSLKCIQNRIHDSPSCQIGCQEYEDEEGSAPQMHDCKVDGTWEPPLPPCVEIKRDGDLVRAPEKLEHDNIDYPKG